MQLSEKEFLAIQETDFLLTKSAVIPKIQSLMEITREHLIKYVDKSTYSFPEGIDLSFGKISRGENYRNLPYMVLDYPATFSNENIFAYRTMFWWGNFFSATLHLEGNSLEISREKLSKHINNLTGKEIYICIGNTPWQYHYGDDNYLPVTKDHKEHIGNCNFLKVSKKMKIKDWEKLPAFSSDFLKLLLNNI